MCRKKTFRVLAGFVFIAIALPSMSVDVSAEPVRLGSGKVSTFAFSPDGAILAASHRTDPESDVYDRQVVILWDPQTQEQVDVLEMPNIYAIAFSPDGTLLALGGGDNKIRLWDLAGQNQIGLMQSPTLYGVNSLAFSPDGKILASSGYGGAVICLWDVQGTHRTRRAGRCFQSGRQITVFRGPSRR